MDAGLAQKSPSLLNHVLPVTTVQQSRIWTAKESFRRLLEADISRQKKKKRITIEVLQAFLCKLTAKTCVLQARQKSASGSAQFKLKFCFYGGLGHGSRATSASLCHTATGRPHKVIRNSMNLLSDRQGHLLYIWSLFNVPQVLPILAQFSFKKKTLKKSKAVLSDILPELQNRLG